MCILFTLIWYLWFAFLFNLWVALWYRCIICSYSVVLLALHFFYSFQNSFRSFDQSNDICFGVIDFLSSFNLSTFRSRIILDLPAMWLLVRKKRLYFPLFLFLLSSLPVKQWNIASIQCEHQFPGLWETSQFRFWWILLLLTRQANTN